MPRLIWTPAALADVQRLYRFLAERDVEAARRVVKALRSGVQILAHQPRLGRPVENMDAEYREWLIYFDRSGYVVLYRIDNDVAVVLAVRHQRVTGY